MLRSQGHWTDKSLPFPFFFGSCVFAAPIWRRWRTVSPSACHFRFSNSRRSSSGNWRRKFAYFCWRSLRICIWACCPKGFGFDWRSDTPISSTTGCHIFGRRFWTIRVSATSSHWRVFSSCRIYWCASPRWISRSKRGGVFRTEPAYGHGARVASYIWCRDPHGLWANTGSPGATHCWRRRSSILQTTI